MAQDNRWENPYLRPDYVKQFRPDETDGLQEWALQPGYTVGNLTLPEGVVLILTAFTAFAASVLSLFLSIGIVVVVASLLYGHKRLKAKHGVTYISRLLWLKGIIPPSEFFPFTPVAPGRLKKVGLTYRLKDEEQSGAAQ